MFFIPGMMDKNVGHVIKTGDGAKDTDIESDEKIKRQLRNTSFMKTLSPEELAIQVRENCDSAYSNSGSL